MDKRKDVSHFLYLLGMALFIYVFSVGGSLAYDTVMAGPVTYNKGTTVGSVPVEGFTEQEATEVLSSRVKTWKETHPVVLLTTEEEITFPKEFLSFNVSETLANIQQGKANPLIVQFDRSQLNGLEEQLGEEVYENLLLDKLTKDVLDEAQVMSEAPLQLSVYDYVSPGTEALYTVIAEYNQPIQESVDVFTYVNELDGLVIGPETNVSLLEQVTDAALHDQKALNIVSSGVYGAVLQTNFSIIQRHISNHIPSYAVKGREASLNLSEQHDFVFFNPNEANYTLRLEVSEDVLTVQMVGYPLTKSYRVVIEDEQVINPRTIVQYNDELYSPYEKQKGIPGTAYEVYREIVDLDGVVMGREFITEDYYSPVHKIEERPEPVQTTSSSSGNRSTGVNDGDSSGASDSNDGEGESDEVIFYPGTGVIEEGDGNSSSSGSSDTSTGNVDGTDGIWSPEVETKGE